MRAPCRVCWRPFTLTRRGLVWRHSAPVALPDGRRPRCLGAGEPPLGRPGPEWPLLPQVLDARAQVLAPERPGPQGTVYLVCLDEPFGHARHYLGWAGPGNLAQRQSHHRAGSGSNLLRHVAEAGIGWQVVRTWAGDRHRERQLKARGKSRACPRCSPQLVEHLLGQLAA